MSRTVRFLAAVAAFALPAALSAQGIPAPAGAALPSAKNQVLSIQPLSGMFTVYAGEFERKISPKLTLGVGGTHWGADETVTDETSGESVDAGISYTSADLKLRYYPGAQAFQGFSFGVQGGYTRASGKVTDESTGERAEASVSGPTFGVALDYNWLLGAAQSFYVGLGVGAKAAFIDGDELDGGVTGRYPTARVSIGWGF